MDSSVTTAESIAEPQQILANPTLTNAKPRVGIPFTTDNAREMGRRGAEARKYRAGLEPEAQPDPKPDAPPDGYILGRLMRVRKQLARIDDMMDRERDPQKLDRLASAQARVSEQERVLSGRPLPGSFKPTAPRSASKRDVAGPV